MYVVSIRSDENGHTKVFVDGVDMSARCYKLAFEQEGGEFPRITLTLGCDVLDVELERVDVKIEKMTAPAATDAVN